jgi:hypothetical protein
LEIKKKHFGEDHVEHANTQNNLCYTFDNLKEYEKAKEGNLNTLELKKKK